MLVIFLLAAIVGISNAQDDGTCGFKAGIPPQQTRYTFADALADMIFSGEVLVGDPQELGYLAEVQISFCDNIEAERSCVAGDPRFNGTFASIEQFQTIGDQRICDGYLARWDGPDIMFDFLEPMHPEVGVFMSFTNGQVTGCEGIVNTTLNLHCSDGLNDPPFTYISRVEDESDGLCVYQIDFHTPEACLENEQIPTGPAGGVNKLSGGWIFVIIFLVAILVYLVVGVLYKSMQMGTSGVESIPNIDFWRSIPQLVREGCSYTRACMCGGGSGSYDDVTESRGGTYHSAGGQQEVYNPISSAGSRSSSGQTF